MNCLSKRQMTYIALTFPALVYLFLMFSVIGQVCFRSESDQASMRLEYVDLIKTVRGKGDNRPLSAGEFSQDSIDSRRLLNTGDSKSPPTRSDNRRRPTSPAAHNHQAALEYNCSSISSMRIRSKIGHGVSKQAFLADYHGLHVAIKMVTRHIHELKTCLEQLRQQKLAQEILSRYEGHFDRAGPGWEDERSAPRLKNSPEDDSNSNFSDKSKGGRSERHFRAGSLPLPTVSITSFERQKCYTFPTARLMKEILLSQQLSHHNLVKLLGYCVRSEESESTDISEHGVVSVFELGSHFVLDNLQILPWPTRLRHALEMADLLNYLEHSPLGSLIVPDFKEGHLLMVNDSLKLIDLDDVNNLEPECDPHKPQEGQCPYNL
ncbi:hypothetical protein Btru_038170, partial [Bulinus truncatus]